ncbi:MAG: cupin domain-containing protein [Halorubrum sp.]
MGYDEATYTDVEPRAPGMYFLRDALGAETLGVTVVEADDGWDGIEHDHADDGHEEVYLLLEGSASLTVDDDTIEMAAGDAVRVDPESTRTLSFDAADSQMVIAGAP